MICQAMLDAGRDPDTPAIAVSWGTTDQQQSVSASLISLPDTIAEANLPTPVVVVIGPVAALSEKLSWFQADGAASGFVPFPET